MRGGIINNIAYTFLAQEPGLFRHQLERDTLEHVLLRRLGERADQDTYDIVRGTEKGNMVDVVQHVFMRNFEDRDRLFDGRGFLCCRRHYDFTSEG